MDLNEQISGTGSIEFHEEIRLECEFDILQYFDGSIEIECRYVDQMAGLRQWLDGNEDTAKITGRTRGGQAISFGSRLRLVQSDGGSVIFGTNEITIADPDANSENHSYLLTNVEFPESPGSSLPDQVSLSIPTRPSATPVTLAPRQDFRQRKHIQRRHKQPTPTATLSFVGSSGICSADEFASEVCIALSIVLGQKVNWITHEAADNNGRVSYKQLRNRVTMQSSELAIDRQSGNNKHLPLIAVQDCYCRNRELQQAYDWKRVLEIWLESRTDADYLETRALKCVLVIEALCVAVRPEDVQSTILEQKDWDAFKKYILPLSQEYLASERKVCKRKVATIVEPNRWKQLNRKSFRWKIKAAFKKLEVKEPLRSVELFIASRDTLMHEGRFRCDSTPEKVRSETDAPQDRVREYLFIEGFVDRVIMKAVGLGAYLCKPSSSDTVNTPLFE